MTEPEQGWALLPEALLSGLADLFDPVEPSEWQERALCAQTDPESFFPDKGESTRAAKLICSMCEVKAECLEYAVANRERFGIWGGLSERERRKLTPQSAPARVPAPVVDRDAEIIRLDASGAPIEWVAEQAGVTTRTVERARARHAATATEQSAA